jgi:hypothetical protein
MATVQEDILSEFYAKLTKSGSIDETTVDALRKVLQSANKLKADDFVAILGTDPKGKTP